MTHYLSSVWSSKVSTACSKVIGRWARFSWIARRGNSGRLVNGQTIARARNNNAVSSKRIPKNVRYAVVHGATGLVECISEI